MESIIETLQQKIELFNAASGGTLVLTTAGFNGDFIEKSFWASIQQAQRRVDRYAPNTAAPVTDLTQLREAGVKVAGGFGPIAFEPSQMTWLQKPTIEAISNISDSFSTALLADQINTLIACLVAAISNQADSTNDVSATGPITHNVLNGTHAKFGDQSMNLRAQVMTGSMAHRIIGQNITNQNTLFRAEGVNVVDILGKITVVTDAPALFEAGAPGKDKVLSLSANAGTVYDGSDVIGNIETNNGNLRIANTMQFDYSFGATLKGYSWDTAGGGKSPDDATLQTGTNWGRTSANSVKTTAGCITIGQAA